MIKVALISAALTALLVAGTFGYFLKDYEQCRESLAMFKQPVEMGNEN